MKDFCVSKVNFTFTKFFCLFFVCFVFKRESCYPHGRPLSLKWITRVQSHLWCHAQHLMNCVTWDMSHWTSLNAGSLCAVGVITTI